MPSRNGVPLLPRWWHHARVRALHRSWSVSFYPQVLLNFQRKTSVGLSFDFLLYNVLAFSCYAAFTCEFRLPWRRTARGIGVLRGPRSSDRKSAYYSAVLSAF